MAEHYDQSNEGESYDEGYDEGSSYYDHTQYPQRATAAYDYEAQTEEEVSFSAGDEIEIDSWENDGWCTGRLVSSTNHPQRSGLFSPSFLTFPDHHHVSDSHPDVNVSDQPDPGSDYADQIDADDLDPSDSPMDVRKVKRKMMLEQRNQLRSDADTKSAERAALEAEISELEARKLDSQSVIEKLDRMTNQSDFVLEVLKLSMMFDELTYSQQQAQNVRVELVGELKALQAILNKELKTVNALDSKQSLNTTIGELSLTSSEHERRVISWWTNKLEFHQRLEHLRSLLTA